MLDDNEIMTFKKLILKYPNAETDLLLLWKSKQAAIFWVGIGGLVIGLCIGVMLL